MDEMIIRAKFLYKKAVTNEKYKNILDKLINDYYSKIECNHDEFFDQGYYKTRNGEIYATNRDEANFRYIKCSVCGENIFLLKTVQENWDVTYKNKTISVTEPSKIKINSK